MLPIWVGFSAPISPNKDLFFGRFSSNMGGFSRNWQRIVKMDSFPPKLIIKVGMTASFGNKERQLSENQALDPRLSASKVPPPPPG